tara:strand:- start:207 stop:1241 length:1035 start_codon:yes stop_codon:yes gene_type:complete
MTYIIGEIGQNHNGSVKIAKQIIDSATSPIVEQLFNINLPIIDAVKLTKRDLNYELSDSQMAAPYINKNAFGNTYGEHRAFLELSDEEHHELYNYAKNKGIDFVETLCAPSCLSILRLFQPDKLKVASRDLTNIPLLEAMAETKVPLIISTGMAGDKELDKAIETITKYHHELSILHCVSQYPTEPENVNLNTIAFFQEKYSEFTIGYSDHTIGIAIPIAAVAMGAQIIEKHITLDRKMKGTDQIGSLGPDGLNRMIRDIRLLEKSMGKKEIFICKDVATAQKKLERSIATKKTLKKGDIIQEEDIHLLSPGDGYKWSDKNLLVGKYVTCNIPANEIIYPNMLS